MDLRGKVVLTTRAASQSSDLRTRLTALGAEVLECPTIEIVPPDDWSPVDAAVSRIAEYDWVLFTSSNAVDQFMNRVQLAGADIIVQLAAVGSGTAARLQHWHLTPSLVPSDFRAEGLLEAFPADLRNVRILFPRAERARELLPDELRQRGAVVDIITVYRTVKSKTTDLRQILQTNRVDCIVFTSESTIRYLAESVDMDLSCLKGIPVAVIGPITRNAAEGFGLQPSIEPEKATIPDMVEAIRRALSSAS